MILKIGTSKEIQITSYKLHIRLVYHSGIIYRLTD